MKNTTNSSRQIKSGLDPYLCCPNCGEPELFENIKENNIKCYNCGNTISYDELNNLKKYVSPHSKITSARRPIKSSIAEDIKALQHQMFIASYEDYQKCLRAAENDGVNVDNDISVEEWEFLLMTKPNLRYEIEKILGYPSWYVKSSRQIKSARYIATDPETGEVLGSADTYEEAVNEWGEDVTITDSEVSNGTDTTQGGILSSWDNDTPRGEGWLAHDDGKQKNECPYERGTVEYEDWIDGWEAAYQEVNSSKESNHQFNQRIVNSVLTKEITEDDAIKQIASRNNMNIGFAKRIFNNLMEDKSLIQSGVMEMADDINKDFDLNGDLYSWFDDYVEDDGKSTTVGGELVRAAHRILERFENDGDKIGMGYGKETVNPAARYILAICNDYIDRNDIEEMLYNESRINYSDKEYDAWLQQFERTFEDYLRNHEELFHAPNKNDIWDYKEDDDVDSSVTECCIYDDDGNEYWFQKDDDGWKCTSIEYTSNPKYEVDNYVDDLDDIPDTSDDFCDFELDGFEYSAERASNGEDWIITNVSIDNGLADVNDIWETEDFEDYGIFDANGREINVSDLY